MTGGHILTLTGDNAANDIRINDSGAGLLDVRINGGPTVTYTGVNTLDINAGNGSTGGSWLDHVLVTNTTTSQTIAASRQPSVRGAGYVRWLPAPGRRRLSSERPGFRPW